jgi:RNA polymerase sigma factor (sigma-70 family)
MPASSPTAASTDATFDALRPRLFAIAYRMLGTRADAEDVLQDAWLRWHQTDPTALQSAEAWLVTVVTRLSIDRLRAAKTEREAYIGWWLPEPLVELDERTPEAAAELAGDLSVALLWVLERLSPEERAAFLLRQVFDHDYAEIAGLLGKTEAACRQMVHRAADRVQQERPRFDVSQDAHRSLLQKFMAASKTPSARCWPTTCSWWATAAARCRRSCTSCAIRTRSPRSTRCSRCAWAPTSSTGTHASTASPACCAMSMAGSNPRSRSSSRMGASSPSTWCAIRTSWRTLPSK